MQLTGRVGAKYPCTRLYRSSSTAFLVRLLGFRKSKAMVESTVAHQQPARTVGDDEGSANSELAAHTGGTFARSLYQRWGLGPCSFGDHDGLDRFRWCAQCR
jgi:hypothetical protein